MPYTPKERHEGFKYSQVFQVYDGVSATDPSLRVLIFQHDKKSNPPPRPYDTLCAQNALKRLRMMRHPHVLKFVVRKRAARQSAPPPLPIRLRLRCAPSCLRWRLR